MRDPSDAEDIEQVERFLDGDVQGFEVLFDKYREKVYRVAYRFVRNKEDSLEVTQEVFLRVYQNLPKFKTNSKFFTWLYRITVNRSIDFTRSRKARPVREMDGSTLEQLERSSADRRSARSGTAACGSWGRHSRKPEVRAIRPCSRGASARQKAVRRLR